jgi:hypothetical protein
MNVNKWTLGLASLGIVSLASVAQADEAPLTPVLTKFANTTLSGYIDTTASWALGSGNANYAGHTYDGANPGYAHDGFNVNVVSLTLDKPLDEGTWSAGYHVQALLGPGATKRGTGPLISGGGNLSFNEAYVALRVPVGNGIDLKVGQFGTYNGYEAYDTYKNPNWSRSYGFFIESSAHTGVSASYKISDLVSVMAGIGNAAGYNNAVDAVNATESRKAYLAMVTFTAPESFGFAKGGTLSVGYTAGDTFTGGTSDTQQNFYAGLSLPLPVTGLSLGLAYDYTANQSGSVVSSDYANAVALYLSYQASEKLKLNFRADYGSATAGGFGTGSTTTQDELLSLTLTADYALWKNVISRAEFRWDHSLNGNKPFGTPVVGGGFSKKNSAELTANIIYLF